MKLLSPVKPILFFKEPGDTVYSGTVNVDGQLTLRATGVGEERVMAKLVRLLREAVIAPRACAATRRSGLIHLCPSHRSLGVKCFCFWSLYVGSFSGFISCLSSFVDRLPVRLGVATPLAIWAAWVAPQRAAY